MTNTCAVPKQYRFFARIPVRVPTHPDVRKFVYVSQGIVYINLCAKPDAKRIEYYP